jgi:hypothetical protein
MSSSHSTKHARSCCSCIFIFIAWTRRKCGHLPRLHGYGAWPNHVTGKVFLYCLIKVKFFWVKFFYIFNFFSYDNINFFLKNKNNIILIYFSEKNLSKSNHCHAFKHSLNTKTHKLLPIPKLWDNVWLLFQNRKT